MLARNKQSEFLGRNLMDDTPDLLGLIETLENRSPLGLKPVLYKKKKSNIKSDFLSIVVFTYVYQGLLLFSLHQKHAFLWLSFDSGIYSINHL